MQVIKEESPKAAKQYLETESDDEEEDQVVGKTLFLFPQESKFRMLCFKIQKNIFFESFILLLILGSSIMIALDNPLSHSKIKVILSKVFIALTIIFVVETIIKVVAKGVIFCGPNSYLLNPWNILDFVICITSVIDISATNSNYGIVKIFRLLRVIRPLRLISKNDSLKIAMKALLNSSPNLFQLFSILFIFFVLFGTLMVSIVKGALYRCYKGELSFRALKVQDKWDCLNTGATWDTRNNNFDSFILSIQTFFDFTSGHKIGVMWMLVDSVA